MVSALKKFFKKAYFKTIFSLSSNNSWLYRKYVASLKPSPGSFDSILDKISKERDGIIVVQVGANDGITHDPIHKFIRRDHWSGLLIEPQPFVFNEFLEPLHQRTPDIRTVNAAIGDSDGSAEIHMIGFSDDRGATGLARFRRESLHHLIASGGLERRLRKEGITLPSNQDEWIKSEHIKDRSFKSLFDEHDIGGADILMIDTEGFDFEILKLFPWHTFKPKLVAYECFHLTEEDLEASKNLLKAHDYQCHRDGPNIVGWLPEIDHLVDY